jgi:Fic family protein
MSDGSPHGRRDPHDPRTDPAIMKREAQVLSGDELIVYEAVATLRGPMEAAELVATTGLGEDTVRSALDRLTALEMVVQDEGGTRIGPNDWDVRGAR